MSPRHRARPRRSRSPGPARRPAPPARSPKPSTAELRLLALAREVTAPGRPEGLAAVVETVAAAFGPHERLPRALTLAWQASRTDKTRALALAWAREQLRLGLQEAVERAAGRGALALTIPADTLAWLLLAACESLAQEPPGAVPDRLRALLELSGAPGPAA